MSLSRRNFTKLLAALPVAGASSLLLSKKIKPESVTTLKMPKLKGRKELADLDCPLPYYEVVSLKITTTQFELEQIFTQGDLAIQESINSAPKVEVTIEVARYHENLLATYNLETDPYITLNEQEQQTKTWKSLESLPTGNCAAPKTDQRVYYQAHAIRILQDNYNLLDALDVPCVKESKEERFTVEIDAIQDNDTYIACVIPMMKITSISWEPLPEDMKYRKFTSLQEWENQLDGPECFNHLCLKTKTGTRIS